MQISALSDEALLAKLHGLCAEGHRLTAGIVVHLGEVEERSLHLKAACSSMFDHCVRKLGMSEGAAQRRLVAARVVRRFPFVLECLERGDIHLSGLAIVAKHLTESNVDEIVTAIAGKSVRQIEHLLARHAPMPDVPDRVCKLAPTELQASLSLAGQRQRGQIPATSPTRIAPLSDYRYKVQFTASSQVREKLELARDRMRHRNPSGDLAMIIEQALDLLLDKLEKERHGKAERPRAAPTLPARSIPRAVRREVFERDGEQCTFLADDGQRCPSRAFLELDHIDARARGGSHDPVNLRVRCRSHNKRYAEDVFGKEYVATRIHLRRRRSTPSGTELTRKPADAAPTPLDLALRGLVNLGFSTTEARRALDDISRRHESHVVAASDLLREAIAALT